MEQSKEREAFEQQFSHLPLRRGELKPDSYWHVTTAAAWDAWKARAALSAGEAQPGNGVMVDRGALQAAINMLRRDAAEGRHARGELADELSRAAGMVADSAQAEYCHQHCQQTCQNSVHGVCDGPPSQAPSASSAAMTDEQIDMIWSDTRETLPQPVSEAFTMRAFARALLAPPPAAELERPTQAPEKSDD